MKGKKKLKVLSTVSEVVPFIATGGMGQVAGALTRAMAENDPELDIRIVSPLYAEFRSKYEPQMTFLGSTYVSLAWRSLYCGVFELALDGVKYYFIDNQEYFGRERAYGYYDDGERFAFFSQAVFAAMEITGYVPDVIHAHD